MSPLAVTMICIGGIILALFVAYYFQVVKKNNKSNTSVSSENTAAGAAPQTTATHTHHEGRGKVLPVDEFGKLVVGGSDVVLLDVRTPEEFRELHIPGAVNIDALEEMFVDNVRKAVPVSQKIALYCRSGRRTAEAARQLVKAGYDVTDLDGGIIAWKEAGLPVE